MVLAFAQKGSNRLAPGIEDRRQPFPESRIERRHFLGQIVQLAATPHICGPNRNTLNSANQSLERGLDVLQRTHPFSVNVGGDDLIDDGVAESFLAFEVVVQCTLSDPSHRQDGVQAGTLKSRPVNLARCRLQQALPSTLGIAQPSGFWARTLFRIPACHQHTNQYVCKSARKSMTIERP